MIAIFRDHRFAWLVFLLLALLGGIQFFSVLGDSQTADEGVHLAAGYSYLKTGDFRLNYMHPPLGKYINALPLLLLNPRLPIDDPSWKAGDDYQFGKAFLYSNNEPADTLLLYGRIPTIILTMCLGLVIAVWTRRHFDPRTALLALLLFSFDPNIIAHGRYITSDLIVTLAIFVACLAWSNYLGGRTRGSLLRSGLVLGTALLTKASAVILLPIFVVLYLMSWWQETERKSSLKQLTQALAVCGGLAFAVVWAGYGFETTSALSDKALARRFQMSSEELRSDSHVSNLLRRLIDPSTAIGTVSHGAVEHLRVPAYTFVRGVYWQADKNKQGQDSYLLGEHSQKGWWYYFLVALAVKLPTGVICLLAFSLYVITRQYLGTATRGITDRLRELPLKWYVVTIPPAVYFCASITSNINIGIRHILPIMPFLYIFLSAVLLSAPKHSKRIVLGAVTLFGALVVVESLDSYPYYTSFFNTLAGGSARGTRYLTDSNIDWGQDLKRLKTYLAAHGNGEVCLSYFGHADPEYYGINYRALTDDVQPGSCNIAISVNSLYSRNGQHEWLKRLTPEARIGYSIYYYDQQKQRLP